MDINYDHLKITVSNEVRGLDNYVKVVRWWMQHHEPSEDFWVKTPIETISDRSLSAQSWRP